MHARRWGLAIAAAVPFAVHAGDGESGKFELNCVACHGASLQGVDGQGVNLVTSAFVGRKSVAELVEFLKVGRMPDDPDSVAGRSMPAFGWLPEADLADIATYVKARHGP
jgi:mono/diheme cytochrome c family protein